MEGYEHFSPSELLQAYLEGELERDQAEELFRHLADNAELRMEMHESMSVQRLLRQDSDTLLPSNELKGRVFRAVGVTPSSSSVAPLSSASTHSTTGSQIIPQSLGRNWWHVRNYGLVAVVSVLATILVMQFASRSAGPEWIKGPDSAQLSTLPPDQTAINPPASDQQMTPGAEGQPHSQGTRIARDAAGMASANIAETTPERAGQVLSPTNRGQQVRTHGTAATSSRPRDGRGVPSNGTNQPTAMDYRVSAPAITHTPSIGFTSPAIAQAFTPTNSTNKPVPTVASRIVDEPEGGSLTQHLAASDLVPIDAVVMATESNWQLMARGFAARSFPETAVSPKSSPEFKNVALSVLYRWAPNHYIGVEVGQEAFPQVFRGQEEDLGVTIFQAPLLLWGGVTYQYDISSLALTQEISPFVRSLLGATEVGPLARGMVGVRYAPRGPLSLLVGLEGSILPYQFQNTWFFSRKLGITYGVSLKL